jgi:hypothetical protein
VTVVTGILTGIVCVGISRVVETLVAWRNDTVAHLLDTHESFLPAFGINLAYGLTLTAVAACMVCFLLDASCLHAGWTVCKCRANCANFPELRALLAKTNKHYWSGC